MDENDNFSNKKFVANFMSFKVYTVHMNSAERQKPFICCTNNLIN